MRSAAPAALVEVRRRVRANKGGTDHPLGCHRSRIPERVVFEKLVQVLVFGCACERGEQDPAQETGRLARLLDEIEAKLARFQYLYAEGVIEMEDLRARLSPEDRNGLCRRLNLLQRHRDRPFVSEREVVGENKSLTS